VFRGLGLIFSLESVGVLGVKGHGRVVYVLYKFSHSVYSLDVIRQRS